MYLIDILNCIATSDLARHVARQSAGVDFLLKSAEECLAADPHVFEESALRAAADIRIDTPDRLDRVMEAVLSKKRKIFIEASSSRRHEIFRSVRGHGSNRLQEWLELPLRVGLLIDADGDGRATVSTAWNFARFHLSGMEMPLGRLEREIFEAINLTRVSLTEGVLDLNRPRPSLEDFNAMWDENGPLRKRIEREVLDSNPSFAFDLKRVCWRHYKFMQASRIRPRPGSRLAILDSARSMGCSDEEAAARLCADVAGESIYMVAFLALLDAGPASLASRIRPARAATRKNPKTLDNMPRRRLSVITLDLADRALGEALDRQARDPGRREEVGPSRKSPVRHPVRGHLFLARNGKMVYRMPHWRGSGTGPHLTRVRA